MASEDKPKGSPIVEISREDADEACLAYLNFMKGEHVMTFDQSIFKTIEFVKSSPGRTEWKFTVTEDLCNISGNLHGGCAATIMDDLTSTATMTYEIDGELQSSVSRNINCTYLKALPMGEECTVVAEATRLGLRLWNLKGEIRGSDGKVAVICIHDKVRTGPWKL